MNARRLLLTLVLAATLAASWWALNLDDDEPTIVLPVERGPRAGANVAVRAPAGARAGDAGDRLEPLSAQRPPWPEISAGVAQIVRFTPPPAPAPVLRVEPQAPPLPFGYVGAIDDAEGKAVFLLEGSQVRMVRTGEEIGGRYRLERITPSSIEFTYLPLNKTQFLNRQNR